MKPWSRNSEELPPEGLVIASSFADGIRGELGMRLDYDDPKGELENLENILNQLALTEISLEAIEAEATARATQLAEKSQADTIANHQSHVRAGSILVVDEANQLEDDDCGWMALPQHASTFAFEAAIAAQEDEPITIKLTKEVLAETVNDFAVPLNDLAQEICELIPPAEINHDVGVRKSAVAIARYVFKSEIKSEDRVFRVFDEAAQEERDRQIARKSRRLQATLRSIIDDPTDFFATLFIEAHQEEILEHGQDTAEWGIASRNTQILKERGFSISKPYYEEKEDGIEEVSVVSDVQEELISKTSVEVKSHEAVGIVEMNFPWMSDEPELAGLSVVRSSGHEVYVTRAMGQKFAEISSTVRENSPRDKDGLCRYERIIRHHARRLAEGVLPHQNTNSVKPLRGVDYAGVPVWYTHDISPNTPRVYFTVKKMGELTDETVTKNGNSLNSDQLCMVILAETDKAHQIDVVKDMTGRSRGNLRKGGVGSI